MIDREPLNAETPLSALDGAPVPPPSFYVRSHYAIPALEASRFRLEVEGAVRTPLRLTLDALARLAEPRTVAVTLECAGNGRSLARPQPAGTAWRLGAVATQRFTGVPLASALARAGLDERAVEVAFFGADRGKAGDDPDAPFGRSLPRQVALGPEPLLAWAMDEQPLRPEHGSPLRLVVPGWYGVASVKWLARIRALTEPFQGFFQTQKYRYRGERGTPDGAPVDRMRVRALIARPADGERLRPGRVDVAGSAWSGAGAIVRVELSTDGGGSWRDAELRPRPSPYAATPWRLRWQAPAGRHALLARATDAAGATQPLEPIWNQDGYGQNAAHRIDVTVE